MSALLQQGMPSSGLAEPQIGLQTSVETPDSTGWKPPPPSPTVTHTHTHTIVVLTFKLHSSCYEFQRPLFFFLSRSYRKKKRKTKRAQIFKSQGCVFLLKPGQSDLARYCVCRFSLRFLFRPKSNVPLPFWTFTPPQRLNDTLCVPCLALLLANICSMKNFFFFWGPVLYQWPAAVTCAAPDIWCFFPSIFICLPQCITHTHTHYWLVFFFFFPSICSFYWLSSKANVRTDAYCCVHFCRDFLISHFGVSHTESKQLFWTRIVAFVLIGYLSLLYLCLVGCSNQKLFTAYPQTRFISGQGHLCVSDRIPHCVLSCYLLEIRSKFTSDI